MICSKLMILKNLNNPRLIIHTLDNGIRMRSGHMKGIKMLFNYDGTYETGKKNYPTIYGSPVLMTKVCPNCHTLNANNPHYIYFKNRSIGYASSTSSYLNDLKTKCCQYTFTINMNSDSTYDVKMSSEYIRWFNSEEFCHISTEFGEYTRTYRAKFQDTLGNVATLNLPPVNLSPIITIDQLLEKLKLYQTFS